MTRPTATADTLRAAHLDSILDSYCSESSSEENLIDILTDAMHWCLLNEQEFDRLLATARLHIDFEAVPKAAASRQRKNQANEQSPPQFTGGRHPSYDPLLDLARELAEFAEEHTESLNFEDYSAVAEQEAKLMAYANLLGAFNTDAFLEDQLREAQETLTQLQQRLKLA